LKSALSHALSVILPAPEHTWLLRACLYSGESGRRGWDVYRTLVDDPVHTLLKSKQGLKTLVPLLLMALRRNDVAVDAALLTHFRTAYVREELRSNIYRRILRDVLSALNAHDVSYIVCKGAALADTVYADPVLRHCHDIDILLLTDDDLTRAASLLPPMGYSRSGEAEDPETRPATWLHDSGLPLLLHRRLFRVPQYDVLLENLWRRRRMQSIAGVPTHVLSPADNLLHVCIQAASCPGSRQSLRWVPDAWNLMARHPNLDWQVVEESAVQSHLAPPLSVTLGYLAEELNAPVPPAILDRLRNAASQTDAIMGETALSAALAGARLDLKRLIRIGGGWRSRALIIKWIVYPSPNYVRSVFRIDHSWLLPFYYVYRPLRFLARLLRSLRKNRTDRQARGDIVSLGK
jgi:hypothetical protein